MELQDAVVVAIDAAAASRTLCGAGLAALPP
jgi:hypothetical protein